MERLRLPSFEKDFETLEIPVRVYMGDGTVREGEEVYIRQLRFDSVGYAGPRSVERVNLGRAYFLSGAVIGRFERSNNKKDEIAKVERIDTGEDVWPRVRQSFGPGM